MAKELMQSSRKSGALTLDPRTKLLLIITITTILLSGGNGANLTIMKPILAATPMLLLLGSRQFVGALVYLSLYALGFAAELYLVPALNGLPNFILVAFCGLFSRFAPGIMMGYFLVTTTTVSEFMAAMERMHMPKQIVIPLSVIFRFFPTVGEEYSAISDAMRMRGVRFGGGKPSAMLEYRLVPLMMSTVKIGEELSAAALTRGLGKPVKRTNICKIGFHIVDIAAFVLCVASFAAFIADRFTM